MEGREAGREGRAAAALGRGGRGRRGRPPPLFEVRQREGGRLAARHIVGAAAPRSAARQRLPRQLVRARAGATSPPLPRRYTWRDSVVRRGKKC